MQNINARPPNLFENALIIFSHSFFFSLILFINSISFSSSGLSFNEFNKMLNIWILLSNWSEFILLESKNKSSKIARQSSSRDFSTTSVSFKFLIFSIICSYIIFISFSVNLSGERELGFNSIIPSKSLRHLIIFFFYKS